jgi:hypothetical protein
MYHIRVTLAARLTSTHTRHIHQTVALVRKRTIPTERPPLVGEVSTSLLRAEGVTWSAQRIPTAVNLGFLDLGRYLFSFK